jgi:hypothetical protein
MLVLLFNLLVLLNGGHPQATAPVGAGHPHGKKPAVVFGVASASALVFRGDLPVAGVVVVGTAVGATGVVHWLPWEQFYLPIIVLIDYFPRLIVEFGLQ